jgi:hypothetical protein
MSKLRASLAVLLLVPLAACSRSASQVTSGLPATQLASTLQSAATLPPSATPPPSQTTVPSATPTIPPSPTITETPTPGPSPSPTGPPLASDDPRYGLNLSVPDYRDDFSTRFKWFEFSDPQSATNQLSDGVLTTVDHLADRFIWWSTSDQQGANVYAEVSATIGSCQGKDASGLALRVGGANYDRGYALEISCDGAYRLRKFVSQAAPVVLADWTPSEVIKPGPQGQNRLGLLAKANDISGFANGTLLTTVTDPDYVAGTFGLYASADRTPDLKVTFDDFALWYVTP